jgi:branched-chain amino acid transport system ATP-binding protein
LGLHDLRCVGRTIQDRNVETGFADEPAAGQDGEETDRFAALLRSLADEGTAVVLVEHDMGLVMSVCDQVYVLELGKVIAVGPPEAIRRDETVLAAYLGDT